MLCLCHYGPALLRFWFQTDLGRENSASFLKNTGGEDLFLPWSRVGHALRPIFILWLVKILCSFFKVVYFDSWSWQSFVSTVFFHWMYKMKYSYYQESSAILGWLVYWVFGWEMRRLSNRKSDFGWHRFCFSPCLMHKRVEKSQAILAFSNCKPE